MNKRAGKIVACVLAVELLITLVCGCSTVPEPVPSLSIAATSEGNLNPLFVRTENAYYLWEAVVDVLDNYFPTLHESPNRMLESVLPDGTVQRTRTEGRIDTEPVIAAGLLEPWKKNSATLQQRVDATFQTIRRNAVVRIVPTEGGYFVHLAVYNELENLTKPINSNTTNTSLFTDDLSQLELPTGEASPRDGWIPIGRNTELEQYILEELAWRLNNPPEIVNRQTAPKTQPVVP